MYSAESYFWGWMAYSFGVLCLFAVYWLLVRKIAQKWLKHIVIICFLVLFFTPVTAYPDNPYLAPAFFVSLYEGVMLKHQGMGFQRGLAPILAIGSISIVLYGLLSPFLARRKK